jgi:hypothetical protein
VSNITNNNAAIKTDRLSRRGRLERAILVLLALFFAFPVLIQAQRIGILAPDLSGPSRSFAEKLGSGLEYKVKVLDMDLARAAYESVSLENPFNLTIDEAERIGTAIGCEAFILVRSANQRRSAFGRPVYYEAFAAIYVVSSKTGRLIWWRLISREANNVDIANKLLAAEAEVVANEIAIGIRSALSREINEPVSPSVDQVPEEGTPLAKGFRPPVPYRRIKPEYTDSAALYEITATVEAVVDLDASGRIQRVDITRWAGFGLDESVEKAVRSMNWRPAERNGKPLPSRFLLRYNFRKIEKDRPAS